MNTNSDSPTNKNPVPKSDDNSSRKANPQTTGTADQTIERKTNATDNPLDAQILYDTGFPTRKDVPPRCPPLPDYNNRRSNSSVQHNGKHMVHGQQADKYN